MKRAGPLRKKKTQRGRGAWWRPQPRHGHSTQNPTAKGLQEGRLQREAEGGELLTPMLQVQVAKKNARLGGPGGIPVGRFRWEHCAHRTCKVYTYPIFSYGVVWAERSARSGGPSGQTAGTRAEVSGLLAGPLPMYRTCL